MTAPVLAYKKFYVVNPKAATNQIKNPTFASPDFEEDWAASGEGVTIAESGDSQRRGAYSMKVNTAIGVASGAYHGGLSVVDKSDYTFSCDVKGVAGQAMRIYIANVSGTAKATTTFAATGYWQRVEVTHTAAENASTYRVYVIRDAVASTEPFYVDGAQFEQASKASTFFDGYSAGCRWTGTIRNSPSERSANTSLGGELVDLEDYCKVVQVTGLGHGNWNQILTKMTSGGDMYQTHIRKSRNFSIIVDFLGNSLSEIEANRAAVIDLLRPDKLSNLPVNEQFGINWGADSRGHEQRIIRYQGVDVNGNEATNPVDIVCVPLPDTLTDTPDLPTYQRGVLNFTIPSGLLQGAYNEGKELDLYADFPAEHIVKRDPQGNWCKWTGSAYASLITGLNGSVYCMKEGPDGKIYVGGNFTDAGGVAGADYLARWNPVTEAWEAVMGGLNGSVDTMVFDAQGSLYIGGGFTNAGGNNNADYIAKIINLGEGQTPSILSLGTGLNSFCNALVISPEGNLYAGGNFTTAGGVPANRIAMWDLIGWDSLSTGLNKSVFVLTFAPNGNLWIGGLFTNADGTAGDYLCYWDGTAFRPYWYPNSTSGVELNQPVYTITFDSAGKLLVGGLFNNAGGNVLADYIVRWNGTQWESLGSGVNNFVRKVFVYDNEVYASGSFTAAGGLSLADRVAVFVNGAWQPLDIDLPGTGTIYSIFKSKDGSLYIGGAFSTTASSENAETGIVALNLNVTSASANTYPFISVNGPGTLKSITNYTTGKSIMFDGLTLNAREWIGLQFDPLNLKFRGGWDGRGNLMRYVVPGSDYGDFYLKPGNNLISLFYPDSDRNLRSGAWITWSPLFWGLDGALL